MDTYIICAIFEDGTEAIYEVVEYGPCGAMQNVLSLIAECDQGESPVKTLTIKEVCEAI